MVAGSSPAMLTSMRDMGHKRLRKGGSIPPTSLDFPQQISYTLPKRVGYRQIVPCNKTAPIGCMERAYTAFWWCDEQAEMQG